MLARMVASTTRAAPRSPGAARAVRRLRPPAPRTLLRRLSLSEPSPYEVHAPRHGRLVTSAARRHIGDRRLVVDCLGVHRLDEEYVVDHPRRVGQELADSQAMFFMCRANLYLDGRGSHPLRPRGHRRPTAGPIRIERLAGPCRRTRPSWACSRGHSSISAGLPTHAADPSAYSSGGEILAAARPPTLSATPLMPPVSAAGARPSRPTQLPRMRPVPATAFRTSAQEPPGASRSGRSRGRDSWSS